MEACHSDNLGSDVGIFTDYSLGSSVTMTRGEGGWRGTRRHHIPSASYVTSNKPLEILITFEMRSFQCESVLIDVSTQATNKELTRRSSRTRIVYIQTEEQKLARKLKFI